jgi:hypothetical protein
VTLAHRNSRERTDPTGTPEAPTARQEHCAASHDRHGGESAWRVGPITESGTIMTPPLTLRSAPVAVCSTDPDHWRRESVRLPAPRKRGAVARMTSTDQRSVKVAA